MGYFFICLSLKTRQNGLKRMTPLTYIIKYLRQRNVTSILTSVCRMERELDRWSFQYLHKKD